MYVSSLIMTLINKPVSVEVNLFTLQIRTRKRQLNCSIRQKILKVITKASTLQIQSAPLICKSLKCMQINYFQETQSLGTGSKVERLVSDNFENSENLVHNTGYFSSLSID